MTPLQFRTLDTLSAQLSGLVDDILAQSPCELYASLAESDGGKSVSLSANAEGLTYFAFILLKLAKDQKDGNHMHFDADTVLDRCDRDLIIRYVNNPSLRT